MLQRKCVDNAPENTHAQTMHGSYAYIEHDTRTCYNIHDM